MVTSSTQLQNRSFYVVERRERPRNVRNYENCTCKGCKTIVFHYQICKFVTFLPSSSWLPKLPTISWPTRAHGIISLNWRYKLNNFFKLWRSFCDAFLQQPNSYDNVTTSSLCLCKCHTCTCFEEHEQAWSDAKTQRSNTI